MITNLKLTNFRSLGQDVEIKLDRLNLLVGTNSGGKSNILRAISFLREAVRIGLPGAVTNQHGIASVRRHSSGHPRNVRIELELLLHGRPARYGFELTGDRVEEYRVKAEWAEIQAESAPMQYSVRDGKFTGPPNLSPNLDGQSLALTALGGDPRIRPLWELIATSMIYSVNPSVLRVPQKFSSETPMSAEGENWVSVLHTQDGQPWIRELGAALTRLTGDIDAVKATRAASFLVAEFHHRGGSEKTKRWFGADLESDGTLRVAGILTALLQEPALPVIGIEEPEQTVHPGALALLYDYLREASHRSQVLVTTHSPILLNHVDLEDTKVFVVGRTEDGTQVQPLSDSQRDAVQNNLLTLGELMVSGDLQLRLPFPEPA